MNSTVDPFTAYTDTTVAAGTTYVYYVKSVDDEGVTSAASSPITVTVP
jgi:fibronectin type 3 domain-containing protein